MTCLICSIILEWQMEFWKNLMNRSGRCGFKFLTKEGRHSPSAADWILAMFSLKKLMVQLKLATKASQVIDWAARCRLYVAILRVSVRCGLFVILIAPASKLPSVFSCVFFTRFWPPYTALWVLPAGMQDGILLPCMKFRFPIRKGFRSVFRFWIRRRKEERKGLQCVDQQCLY